MTMTHSRRPPAPDITSLRHGRLYRAETCDGRVAEGEYLGIEVSYDDWAIMLRGEAGTASLALDHLTSVSPLAA